MPIMTQQYLTAVYIIRTGLGNRGGNFPPSPPSSTAYGVCVWGGGGGCLCVDVCDLACVYLIGVCVMCVVIYVNVCCVCVRCV